jgi:hypothetical protein
MRQVRELHEEARKKELAHVRAVVEMRRQAEEMRAKAVGNEMQKWQRVRDGWFWLVLWVCRGRFVVWVVLWAWAWWCVGGRQGP